MKAKERFRRMGESRGARGLRLWASERRPENMPAWAAAAYCYGWLIGARAWQASVKP